MRRGVTWQWSLKEVLDSFSDCFYFFSAFGSDFVGIVRMRRGCLNFKGKI